MAKLAGMVESPSSISGAPVKLYSVLDLKTHEFGWRWKREG